MAQWQCPECESESLKVSIEVWAELRQSEDNFETEIIEGNHEWTGNSLMECMDCGYQAVSEEFDTEAGDND